MVLPKTMKQTPRETQTVFLSVTTELALRAGTMEHHLEPSEAAGYLRPLLEPSEAAGLPQTLLCLQPRVRKNAISNLKKGPTPLRTLQLVLIDPTLFQFGLTQISGLFRVYYRLS